MLPFSIIIIGICVIFRMILSILSLPSSKFNGYQKAALFTELQVHMRRIKLDKPNSLVVLREQFYSLERSAEILVERRYKLHTFFIASLAALISAGLAYLGSKNGLLDVPAYGLQFLWCVGFGLSYIWFMLVERLIRANARKLLLMSVMEEECFQLPIFWTQLEPTEFVIQGKKKRCHNGMPEVSYKLDKEWVPLSSVELYIPILFCSLFLFCYWFFPGF